MKIKNNITGENYQEDMFDFTEYETDFEESTNKPSSIKKALAVTVMALSIGIILGGLHHQQEAPEIHQAVKIEDSIWSDFDTSKVSSYFTALSYGSEYQLLEALCSDSSTVYSTVKNNEAKMKYSYDKYYSIAQGIQRFGKCISISHINGVSNNKVSLVINYVSDDDLTEFFNERSNDLCRYFTSHDLSKENLVWELFNLIDKYEVSTTELTIELPVEKVDDLYTISDDSEVCNLLVHTYEKAIDEMVKQLSIH